MPVTRKPSIDDALALLVRGAHRDPFAVLGPHTDEKSETVIRGFYPAARSIAVVLMPIQAIVPMERRHSAGLFEIRITGQDGQDGHDRHRAPDYRLRIT